MAQNENLDIVIRTRGGRQAAAEGRDIARAYQGISGATRSAAAGTRQYSDSATRASGATRSMFRAVGLLTGGLGAMAALKAGINFESTMQTNTVAFTHFLKSASLADKQLKELVKLGQEMPAIGTEAFVTGGRRLLAYGASANKITPWLKALGEASSGLGLGAEGIQRATTAIGQMLSTGFIQGDEINQLVEAGINARKYLIDAGMVPREKAGQIGDLHIESAKALEVIMAGVQRDFGGLAKASAGTWQSQFAAVKNYGAQAAGAFVAPMMAFVQRSIFPGLIENLKEFQKWAKDGGAERFWRTLGSIISSLDTVALILSPLIVLWGLHAGALLLNGIRMKALVVWSVLLHGWLVLLRGVILVATAAQWLWNIAMTANPVGLVIVGIAALIGIIVLMVKHWDWVKAKVMAVWNLFKENPWLAFLVGPIGLVIVAVQQFIKHWDTIKTAILDVWHAVEPALSKMWDLIKKIADVGGNFAKGGIIGAVTGGGGIPGIPFMAAGGTVHAGGKAVVGEAGPELLENDGTKTTVTPMTGQGARSGGRVLQPMYLQVDGRTFAEIMVDVGQTEAARR